jgi:hypothetical protein
VYPKQKGNDGMFLDYPSVPKIDSLEQLLDEKDLNSSKESSPKQSTNSTPSILTDSLSHQAYPLSSVRVIYHVPLECLFLNNIETDKKFDDFPMGLGTLRIQLPYFLTRHSSISSKYAAFLNSFSMSMGLPQFRRNAIQVVLFLDFSQEDGPFRMKLRSKSQSNDVSVDRGKPLLSKDCISAMFYAIEIIRHNVVPNVRFCVVPVMSSFQAAGGELDPPSDVVMDWDDAIENTPVSQKVKKGFLSYITSHFKHLFSKKKKLNEDIPQCLQFYRWFLHYSARYSCIEALYLLQYIYQKVGDIYLEDIRSAMINTIAESKNSTKYDEVLLLFIYLGFFFFFFFFFVDHLNTPRRNLMLLCRVVRRLFVR